jgi:sarcosine oxidase gamma subunit
MLAATHREAREILLAARRRAYEILRQRAYEVLLLQAATQEGRQLSQRLETLVRDRVGASASVRRVGPGGLGVVAEAGNRRAAFGPSELVEQALVSLGPEIETLWA